MNEVVLDCSSLSPGGCWRWSTGFRGTFDCWIIVCGKVANVFPLAFFFLASKHYKPLLTVKLFSTRDVQCSQCRLRQKGDTVEKKLCTCLRGEMKVCPYMVQRYTTFIHDSTLDSISSQATRAASK